MVYATMIMIYVPCLSIIVVLLTCVYHLLTSTLSSSTVLRYYSSQGSRWINHKRKALLRIIDRYGAYVSHLSTLIEDTSLKSENQARIKGYLGKWMQYKIILVVHCMQTYSNLLQFFPCVYKIVN